MIKYIEDMEYCIEDLSSHLDEITNYLLRQYELIAHLLEQRDDLKKININLTEKYEEL